MIYKNLSITAGGGIIAHNQQAEQEECANVFIGLGGTGISCLKEVKKQVFNRLQPDDPTSEVPEYKHIQFLAVDTDASSLGDDNSISTLDSITEFVDMSCKDIRGILSNPRVLRQNPSLQWFGENITIQNAEAGAGGVRQIGRLLTIQNCDKIVSALTNKINLARMELEGKPINIHIFTGMGGGTGAGSFLDICYILQYVLDQLSIAGQSQTCGYFFLPDVNLAKVDTNVVRQYIEINGFAAMKELDYCMNFHVNGGEWNQVYNGFTVKTKEPPVKLAHLITAKNEAGDIRRNGYYYAMNVVVDYVMEFMTKQLIDTNSTEDGFGLKSHIANFERIVEGLKKKRGARYYYCVLGASNAYMPYKDINTYLAAKIFDAYKQLPSTNHEIDNFVNDNGLSYQSLLNEINKGTKPIPIFEVDANLLCDQVAGITPDVIPQVLTQMRDALPKFEGELTKNRESQVQNVVLHIKNKLIEMSKMQDKGPVYASLLLKTDNKDDRDLVNVVDGYITRNNDNLSNARADLDIIDNSVAAKLRELQNAILGKNRKAKEYVSAVHSYYSQLSKIALYKAMGDFLNEFKPQITQLYNEMFKPLNEMLNNVAETFSHNFTTLTDSVRDDDDYAIKIVGLDDESLKESLDEAVDNLNPKQKVIDFIGYMIDNSKSWLGKVSDAKISAAVSEFFVNQLRDFTSKNIDYYLQTKFNVQTQAELANAINRNIMNVLKSKAKPLFWIDNSDGGIDTDSKMGYCSIPSTSEAISAAADELNRTDSAIKKRKSIMPDRISMLIFYCGIPMFQFKGSYNYKSKYHASTFKGIHLYEGTSQDERDFKQLHDIVPLSLLKEEELTDIINKFIEDYALAVDKDIVTKVPVGASGNTFEYKMQLVDKKDLSSKMAKIDKLIKEGNIDRMKKYLDEDVNVTLTFDDSIELPDTGTEGYKDDVIKDHVYASSYLRGIMYAQLDLFAKFNEKLNEMEGLIKGKDIFTSNLNVFAGALCTGLIYQENKFTFKYIKDDDGIEDEFELTSIDTEPFGETIPLYSAFVEFCKMDEEDKKEFSETSKDRQINDEDICLENTKKIKDYLEKRADIIKEVADDTYRNERKDIHLFVESLQKFVRNFERRLL